jgi:hypothetical protein
VTDEAERARLLGYLEAGAVVFSEAVAAPDRFIPSRRFAVRLGYRTDGEWVWPDSVAYYLRWHGVAPEPDLYRRIKEFGYICSAVSDEVVRAAFAATERRTEIFKQQTHERVTAYKLRSDRFPPDVDVVMRQLGWRPGRDVRERIHQWLSPATLDELGRLGLEGDGLASYRPFPVALNVLYEFGGLTYPVSPTGPTTPFRIMPSGSDDDLTSYARDASMLGKDIDRLVFQIGALLDPEGAIIIDNRGVVFQIDEYDERFLGSTIEEALTRLIRGEPALRLSAAGF